MSQGICRNCHEPIEEPGRVALDGTVIIYGTPEHPYPPHSNALLCLDCKLAARGWNPEPDPEEAAPSLPDWPEDEEEQRRRMIDDHNKIDAEIERRRYD